MTLTKGYWYKEMTIEYSDQKEFAREELERLFLSVDWSSGHFPDKLVIAMRNYKAVYSAWDGDKLVGLISAMDDGIMNAYVHYLLVDPEYHGEGVGKKLVEMVKDHYKDYMRICVIAYDTAIRFYEHCGFEVSESCSPMCITTLWT